MSKNKKKTYILSSSSEDEDDIYALIKWIDEEGAFTVLKRNLILINKNEGLPRIGEKYKINYNGKKLDAIVLKLGSFDDCEKQRDIICDYNLKTRKKNSNQVKNNAVNVEPCEEDSNAEIKKLKKIINERDEMIIELQKENNEQITQLERQKKYIENIEKTISICDKQKFLDIGKCILNAFGSSSDFSDLAMPSINSNKIVRLSEQYPSVLVSQHIKLNVEAEIKLNKSKSKIFRILIGSILHDDNIWLNANADTIFEKYPQLVSACIDFLLSKNIDINIRDVRKILREMCHDTKKKYKNQTPSQQVLSTIIDNTILRKPDGTVLSRSTTSTSIATNNL